MYKRLREQRTVLSLSRRVRKVGAGIVLNEYSRSVRMRSRKTAKMLANHEEFPAASLTPKLNQ